MRRPSLARTLVELSAFVVGAAVVTGALFVAAGACASLVAISLRGSPRPVSP